MTSRYHEIVVAIETDDAEGQQAARDRLLRWISTFGHTAAGHGFAFVGGGRRDSGVLRSRMNVGRDVSVTLPFFIGTTSSLSGCGGLVVDYTFRKCLTLLACGGVAPF